MIPCSIYVLIFKRSFVNHLPIAIMKCLTQMPIRRNGLFWFLVLGFAVRGQIASFALAQEKAS